jgi:hypothetical protein
LVTGGRQAWAASDPDWRGTMKAFTLAVLACGFFGVAGPAAAQSIDARRLPDIKRGESLSIVDEDGRRIDGRFVDLSADTITVRRRRGPEQIRIDRVVRIEKPDSLANGAWVGFAVGAGMGVLGAISADADDFPFAASVIISNALVATACGVGFDALVDSRRTLYQRDGRFVSRVGPIVGPGVRGAAVSLRW